MSDNDEDVLELYDALGSDVKAPTPKIKKEVVVLQKRITPITRVVAAASPNVGLSPTAYSPAINNTSEKYGSRAKSGDVIFRYKCKDSEPWETERKNSAEWKIAALNPTAELDEQKFKYMFQKLRGISEALDFVVNTTGSDIIKELQTQEEYKDIDSNASLQDMNNAESLYVGRIRSDGKLTTESVYFEGCLEDSDGHVVNLDFNAVDDYHVFPGQVGVVQGHNELGKCVRVNKFHVPKPLPCNKIDAEDKTAPLNIMIAVGPFTPSDSLQFEPLKDLTEKIVKESPDICILIGPFVESTHKIIQFGGLPETFEEIFQKQVQILMESIKDKPTKVVLVSSYKDIHGHFVYPTPPYSIKRSNKLYVVPDPASISVNGIVIGMTSIDTLMHLSKHELANSSFNQDRMGRFARHLLSQRHFYPLYPCEEELPLDVEQSVKFCRMPTTPHILILPSDLRHFIKEVDGTIVINPERLTKYQTGGTFARIQVDLSTADGDMVYASVADFFVGEIVKI